MLLKTYINALGLICILLTSNLIAKAEANPAHQPVEVIVTFSILKDFVEQIGGDHVRVTSLVPAEGDAHVYTPTPRDAQNVLHAKLIIQNGLGLEGWMARLVQAAGHPTAKVIIATKGIVPNMEHDKTNKIPDPHAWLSVTNAKIYVQNIRDALIEIDPDAAEDYRRKTTAYLQQLDTLDTDVRARITSIPEAQRRIVTTHDAFGYFGTTYGMEFIAPQGLSTEGDVSAQDVVRVIRQIKAQHIPAVFLENITDPRLLKQISSESGAKIGGTLYSDSLSKPEGPAATYIDMMHHNVHELQSALKSGK